ALGLAQVAVGIARLALLGWVLGRVFAGAGLRELALPVALTAAAVLIRAGLEYTRATYAHRTAALVQTRLRQRLYEHVVTLAPALWHSRDQSASRARQTAYGNFASDFLDSIQGLGTLKAFGQSGARLQLLEKRGWALFSSTMWVLAQNTMARGITDAGIAIGA